MVNDYYDWCHQGIGSGNRVRRDICYLITLMTNITPDPAPAPDPAPDPAPKGAIFRLTCPVALMVSLGYLKRSELELKGEFYGGTTAF